MIISSLLGKQDNLTFIGQEHTDTTVWYSCNTTQGTTYNSSKYFNIQLNANHKYFTLFHWNKFNNARRNVGTSAYVFNFRKTGHAVIKQQNGIIIAGNDTYQIVEITSNDTLVYVDNYSSSVYGGVEFNSDNDEIKYEIIIDLTTLGLDSLTAQQFYDKFNPIFDLLASGGSYDTDSMPFMLSESVSVNSKDTDIIADITSGKILWEKPTDKGKYGIVDLGSITFYNEDYVAGRWRSDTQLPYPPKIPSAATDVANIYCLIYQSGSSYDVYSGSKICIAIMNQSGSIRIFDNTVSTKEQLHEKVNGVYLLYEKA